MRAASGCHWLLLMLPLVADADTDAATDVASSDAAARKYPHLPGVRESILSPAAANAQV